MKRKKTNAMRMLERADVEFEVNYYIPIKMVKRLRIV